QKIVDEDIRLTITAAAQRGECRAVWDKPDSTSQAKFEEIRVLAKQTLGTENIQVEYSKWNYSACDNCTQSGDGCWFFLCCCCLWNCRGPKPIQLQFTWTYTKSPFPTNCKTMAP